LTTQVGWHPDEPPSSATNLKKNILKKEKSIYKRVTRPKPSKKGEEKQINHRLRESETRHATSVPKKSASKSGGNTNNQNE